jgi:hypothetical protein
MARLVSHYLEAQNRGGLPLAVLQRIAEGTIAFDPIAPEALRRRQLADLRERLERKAG